MTQAIYERHQEMMHNAITPQESESEQAVERAKELEELQSALVINALLGEKIQALSKHLDGIVAAINGADASNDAESLPDMQKVREAMAFMAEMRTRKVRQILYDRAVLQIKELFVSYDLTDESAQNAVLEEFKIKHVTSQFEMVRPVAEYHELARTWGERVRKARKYAAITGAAESDAREEGGEEEGDSSKRTRVA